MNHSCQIFHFLPDEIPYKGYIIFFLLFSLFACSPSRYLTEDRLIHIENEVKLNDKKFISDPGDVQSDLKNLAVPEPDFGLNDWRLNLNRMIARSGKDSGAANWLKNKIGHEPIYFSESDLELSRARMVDYLFERGYFRATVQTDTNIRKNFVTSVYQVSPGQPYRLGQIDFMADSTQLGKLWRQHLEQSFLKTDEVYREQDLISERDRLLQLALDNGFLDINKQNIIFFLDTIPRESVVDVYMQIEFETDTLSIRPYVLDQTYIFQDYSLMKYTNGIDIDTTKYEGFVFVQDRELLRPKILKKIIPQERGDAYSKTLTDRTLSSLLDLGVYKFVNIKYEKNGSPDSNTLNRYIYLTPGVIRDLSAEIRANTRSGNYIGSGVIFSYTDRNLFNGAERFDFSISGSFETQLGDDGGILNTGEAGVKLDLLLPYIWPYALENPGNLFVPKTRTSLEYRFEKRFEFYTISSLSFQYGFDWRVSLGKRHQLIPVLFNRIQVHETTSQLDDVLMNNPSLRTSFEDVFISGAQYIFSYTSNTLRPGQNFLYFSANVESSGNLAYLVNSLLKGSQEEPHRAFGLPFSQFMRTDFEFRYYIPRGAINLVFRFFGGLGIPYGNADVLPYVKQYYSGGSNGIRAFQIRTLGPGSYRSTSNDSAENEFIDQSGDIKLEANIEYRFPIYGFIKGAFFLDAGNIWLFEKEDDIRQDGFFKFGDFLSEIAVGTGVGLRLDVNSFVVRLDLAFPIRKPYLPVGERWVLEEIDLFDGKWRSENLVWNLALGYPF